MWRMSRENWSKGELFNEIALGQKNGLTVCGPSETVRACLDCVFVTCPGLPDCPECDILWRPQNNNKATIIELRTQRLQEREGKREGGRERENKGTVTLVF